MIYERPFGQNAHKCKIESSKCESDTLYSTWRLNLWFISLRHVSFFLLVCHVAKHAKNANFSHQFFAKLLRIFMLHNQTRILILIDPRRYKTFLLVFNRFGHNFANSRHFDISKHTKMYSNTLYVSKYTQICPNTHTQIYPNTLKCI